MPFWKNKTFHEMNEKEWESLCDGCGRCCLLKLEDEDTGQFFFTDVVCSFFNEQNCSCKEYETRDEKVPDCIRLTPENVSTLAWMPVSCAYRLISEGKDLPDWHPLVSGNVSSVEESGASIKGRVHDFEHNVSTKALLRRVRKWPNEWPKPFKNKPVAGNLPPDENSVEKDNN